MYNLHRIQASQLCFPFDVRVWPTFVLNLQRFGGIGAKKKPGYVQSVWLTWARNLFHVKGLQLICNCENDVESSHDFDLICRSFAKLYIEPQVLYILAKTCLKRRALWTHIDVDVTPQECAPWLHKPWFAKLYIGPHLWIPVPCAF